jgi:hypothetical protein
VLCIVNFSQGDVSYHSILVTTSLLEEDHHVHNIIQIHNTCFVGLTIFHMIFLTFNVRNIPYDIVSPIKHCYGFE